MDNVNLKLKSETDPWLYIPAKFQGAWPADKRRKVRLVVIHSMESAEKGDTAESVGRWFQIIDRPASAHIGVDSNSIVQYVRDNDVAYGAKGVNEDGIQVELAGKAGQSTTEWLDPYGTLMLDRAAGAVAQYCLKYDIPIARLSLEDLKKGRRGIIGHWDATQVYKPNAGHTDPGPNFPWSFFLERVKTHVLDIAGHSARPTA